MFEQGFLGTDASFFMDATTIYFAILPLLLFFSIKYAINKNYSKHLKSQVLIFVLTVIVISFFEFGVRVENGFLEYSKNSKLPFSFLFAFLTIHVNIALVSMIAWLYVIVSTFRVYKSIDYKTTQMHTHKRMGKMVFMGLTISAIMGVCLYLFLFII